jgi:hypothetical protein
VCERERERERERENERGEEREKEMYEYVETEKVFVSCLFKFSPLFSSSKSFWHQVNLFWLIHSFIFPFIQKIVTENQIALRLIFLIYRTEIIMILPKRVFV